MMKYKNLRSSNNIEDMRMSSRSGGGTSRGSMRLLFPVIKFLLGNKYGRIVLVIGAIAYFFGYNPLSLLSILDTSSHQEQALSQPSTHDNETAKFVSAVLGSTEDVWSQLLKQKNMQYIPPKLVLFRSSTQSACGHASKQMGPFYCPLDKKVYLDMSFFEELKRKHNSPGDFAQAYVIAHEVGHHVQNLLGTLNKSHRLKKSSSKVKANAVQVRVELQADCYAGLWAHYLKDVLEAGDVDEALNAASAIGDDTLQKQARGYVTPDSFTHGRSQDRVKWFSLGQRSGKMDTCETGI
jgi:predicted metalloprotease